MPEVDLYTPKGDIAGKINLPNNLFGQKVNSVLLHEIVTMQLANKRLGTASTKTRGEVSGGGIKPWKQKHTGRARSGSIRSPLWRHGGIIFGPRPRDYKYNMPAKKKRLALASALSAKTESNDIVVLDKLEISEPKTKNIMQILKKLKTSGLVLLIMEKVTPEILRATGNIGNLLVTNSAVVNVYEIIASKKMIITRDALEKLAARSI